METKLPPASTPTSPSSPGLSPVPPPDKVDGFSRRSLRRARPRRSHSSSQFRYQSNQQELTPLPLLKGKPNCCCQGAASQAAGGGEKQLAAAVRGSLDSPFQAGDSTVRADPRPQPSLLTHGPTGLSFLEVGPLEVAPPWGADQGQGWGPQPGFQEATSTPGAGRVLEQVFLVAPWDRRAVSLPVGHGARLAVPGAPQRASALTPHPTSGSCNRAPPMRGRRSLFGGICGKPRYSGPTTLRSDRTITLLSLS